MIDPMTQVARTEVEDFLFAEAALLDDWNLDEWLTLFTDDARYVVPSTETPQGDTTKTLALLDDDMPRLRARVRRLQSGRAPREFPPSRTRRFVSNVQILEQNVGELLVHANFIVYRLRHEENLPYIGRYIYRLTNGGDHGFMIRLRRAELDIETLRPHGTVSIIL
jgi:p-cumate 2,3-dioxygenase beta subunit